MVVVIGCDTSCKIAIIHHSNQHTLAYTQVTTYLLTYTDRTILKEQHGSLGTQVFGHDPWNRMEVRGGEGHPFLPTLNSRGFSVLTMNISLVQNVIGILATSLVTYYITVRANIGLNKNDAVNIHQTKEGLTESLLCCSDSNIILCCSDADRCTLP